jgi:hypothetical protein
MLFGIGTDTAFACIPSIAGIGAAAAAVRGIVAAAAMTEAAEGCALPSLSTVGPMERAGRGRGRLLARLPQDSGVPHATCFEGSACFRGTFADALVCVPVQEQE